MAMHLNDLISEGSAQKSADRPGLSQAGSCSAMAKQAQVMKSNGVAWKGEV